jgi:expansin (peptidoglycan-binding protein)
MLRHVLLALALPCLALVAACGGGEHATTTGGSGGSGTASATSTSTGSSSGTSSAGGASSTSSTSTTSGGGGSTGTSMGAPEQGRATYYAADGSGNCGFDPSPNDLDVAAMDAPEWDNSAVCGECVAIQGPNGDVTVRIVDQCPGCEKGHLDLSEEAFAKIADVSAGNVPITWSVVACDVTGNLEYVYKDGSSQWWTAIQVRNSKWAIESLEWKDDGAWSMLARQSYNYFLDSSGVGPSPIQVRVTAVTGEQIIDTLPAPASSLVVQGSAQFM